jgi:phage gp29-like protein
VSWLDRWTQHPSYGLEPAGIAAIYGRAETGDPATQCDLFDDWIERDGHLRSQLMARVLSVASANWLMEPGGDRPEDSDAAKKLEDACRENGAMRSMIVHQLKANWYGYAASEIQWERNRDGLVVPVWFANVQPRRFRFGDPRTASTNSAGAGDPRLLTEAEPTYGVALEPGKWIWSELGTPAVRGGLMRTATWYALFKKQAMQDWVVWSQRFGLPYVTGKYERNATDDEIAKLKRALQAVGTDGYAALPKECELAFAELSRGGGKADDVQGALAARCDAENSKLITGSTLVSETGGSGGSSSYALAIVHEGVSFRLQRWDAAWLGDTFSAAVGSPFIQFNGLKARAPRLHLNVMPDLDAKTLAEVLKFLAIDLGLPLDEDQVRRLFAVKAPTGNAIGGKPAAGKAPEQPTDGEQQR